MTDTFRSQVPPEQWRGLVMQRKSLAVGAKRVELYRMQTRNANVPIPPGGAAAIQYEVRSAQGDRFIERVLMVNQVDGWRPAGYAIQHIPAS